ncbi:hypothetical protein [Roseibium sp. MMSF_3544]|nr:hypothetical protein [Roseibium sp. MMSF_3544]
MTACWLSLSAAVACHVLLLAAVAPGFELVVASIWFFAQAQ